MKMIFICSPYRGKVEKNTEIAKRIAHIAAVCDYVPVVPHLLYPQFMEDHRPEDRIKSLRMGAEQLRKCDEMWLLVGKLSRGMQYMLDIAIENKIPVRLIDSKVDRISPATLSIDDRVDEEFLAAVKGANLV